MAFKEPKMAFTGKAAPAPKPPTSTPPVAKASPNPSRALTEPNVKTAFGTPTKQK